MGAQGGGPVMPGGGGTTAPSKIAKTIIFITFERLRDPAGPEGTGPFLWPPLGHGFGTPFGSLPEGSWRALWPPFGMKPSPKATFFGSFGTESGPIQSTGTF